jgi:hypothetical protein
MRYISFSSLIILTFFILNISYAQIPNKFQQLIEQGEFTKAQKLMRNELANNLELDAQQKLDIAFQITRLDRIKKDFIRSKQYILDYITQYVPDVKEKDLIQWEKDKSLEYWIIDGEKKYFKWAGLNLFRINKKLKAIKKTKDKPGLPPVFNRLQDVKDIIRQAEESGKKYVKPAHVKVTYTLTVDKNVVPDGKTIRCWLPFPREIPNRQTDVKLISSDPERHILSPNADFLQRTVYFEKPAVKEEKTKFQVKFEFKNYAVYQKIDPKLVKSVEVTPELKPFLAERSPHIVFTDELKALSEKIVGKNKNPYFIARKIFKYINDNVPWASAREYSTFANVSDYVYQNHHCDCGMHSIFFITMCRLNGIPTRWQSGWRTNPGGGMHDWGEIYFEPYGWLPVDSDNGLMDSKQEDEKWFFLGGMDAYRLIVNDGFSQQLFPAKIHFRSETIDFQRGEVEWQGGNLYFDLWDWDYQVELLN